MEAVERLKERNTRIEGTWKGGERTVEGGVDVRVAGLREPGKWKIQQASFERIFPFGHFNLNRASTLGNLQISNKRRGKKQSASYNP